MNYYNENDPHAATWLRNLISAGLLPPGVVDDRSIAEVRAADVAGFTQCHFFAGIGGWPYALDLAGWPRDRPIWTGSCPCQPFSGAGRGGGESDARHLWPEFLRLVAECNPATVAGEQVASPAGRRWLAGVRADLEVLGYAFGAADLCAASVSAPHIRQRLYWLADAGGTGREVALLDGGISGPAESLGQAGGSRMRRAPCDGLGDAYSDDGRRDRGTDARAQAQAGQPLRRLCDRSSDAGEGSGRLGDAERARLEGLSGDGDDGHEPGRFDAIEAGSAAATGCRPWDAAEWRTGRDGKTRRVKPGIQLLANGIPGRVGKLRAYGNAIVPQIAAEFIAAYLTCSSAP